MTAVTMMMLDVLQDQEVLHHHKDDRCFGGANMFEIIEFELACVALVSTSQSYSTKARASRETR